MQCAPMFFFFIVAKIRRRPHCTGGIQNKINKTTKKKYKSPGKILQTTQMGVFYIPNLEYNKHTTDVCVCVCVYR